MIFSLGFSEKANPGIVEIPGFFLVAGEGYIHCPQYCFVVFMSRVDAENGAFLLPQTVYPSPNGTRKQLKERLSYHNHTPKPAQIQQDF
jgi:hypothetical protein